MAHEQTLAIIKPDAVARHAVGKIIARLEEGGFEIAAARMLRMTEQQAQDFYAEHAERPFFASLVQFMTSGPVLAMILAGEGAIARYRTLMGATDPSRAEPGTIRAEHAESTERNAVHGSDSPASAERETAFFFPAGSP